MREKKQKKKQREDVELSEEIQDESTLDNTKKHKKKHKKRSKEDSREESIAECSIEKRKISDADIDSHNNDAGKKKKKSKLREESPDVKEEELETSQLKKRKKKKNKHKDFDANEEQEADKQKTRREKKRKLKDSECDVESVSGAHNGSASHSADAVNGSNSVKPKKGKKKRYKDVQEEASINHMTAAAADVGQWATADLGDSNRQTKFYQLLGGFKKACHNKDSITSNPVKPFAAKFNVALDKKREADLNSSLERQFENARFNQLNARGLGLGFSQSKQNSIDISATRSKKFDD